MSQETNLNVSPYFDDYHEPTIGGKDNEYYKVLFKPGYPVQARELTTLQSILQNQVEQVGNHFFKEGAKVIPGSLSYINPFYYVQVEENFLGIPVSLYINELIGKKVRGENSGVVGVVKKILLETESDNGNHTIYIDLIDSNVNLANSLFDDGENLVCEEAIPFGSTFIAANEGFARCIESGASGEGSAFGLGEGVYFLRGYFVDVNEETLILDQYSNEPSYRVGLDVIEEIITSDIDPNLNDNANGFNNYAAPGADRLKITARLAKKDLNSFDTSGFVELARVENGVLVKINESTDYNILSDELARRTFDESGNYYVKAFDVYARESLDNGEGNNGIYSENQLTSSGNTPSDDLMVYKVSPGKAYVRGYEIETIAPSFIDAPKSRSTKTLKNQSIGFNFGSTLNLNNVSGSPSIGINTSSVISLRNDRIGIVSTSPPGKEIGVARVYDFALEAGSYELENQALNRWDISLFDLQTYADLTINEPITLSVPSRVKGSSSGAVAFVKHPVSAGLGITVYQISGTFINGERLIFDGTNETRIGTAYTAHSLSDVKSLFSVVGTANTFAGDIIQKEVAELGAVSITGSSAGVSTITSATLSFPGIVTTGNLLQYSRPNFTSKSFAKVNEVFTNSVVISPVTTVTGICDGTLPGSDIDVSDLKIVSSRFQSNSKTILDSALFQPLSKKNVESVDLTGASLIIRKQYDVTITDNSTNTISSGKDEVFLEFDEERYVLTRSDGSTEELSQDKFSLNSGGNELTINGLGSNTTGRLIATLRKSNVTEKIKRKERINSLIVNKSKYDYSGTGTTTINDGLEYGNYPFGTRVQDERICLNVPDVQTVYGIFESEDTSDPSLTSLTLASMDGPTAKTDDLVIGEVFVGKNSGAKCIYAENIDSANITLIKLNSFELERGELVSFKESGVNAIVSAITAGSKDISKDFVLNSGSNLSYYDYGSIRRLEDRKEPKGKIKIIYSNGYYDSSDTGDFTTANSYDAFDYSGEIITTQGHRATDIIDVRPRVSDYVVAEGSRSPFEFDGRSFMGGRHSSPFVLASDESETVSFSYYLPRIDRLYLTKDGVLQVKYGAPSETPRMPEEVAGALNIANVSVPAYVYNTSQVKISFVEHRRYQMLDISKLERRIKNLEYYTSLSAIENSTSSMTILDSVGQNRFKSGFFIDNFTSVGLQDNTIGIKNSFDLKAGQLRPSHYTTPISLELGSSSMLGLTGSSNQTQDKRFLEDIVGTGVKKTGDVVTLDYEDVSFLEQPYATRVENVTPFLVQNWNGKIKLQPDVDVWIQVNKMAIKDYQMEGSFRGVAEAMRANITESADGSRSGVSPTIWQSWETTSITQDLSMELGVALDSSSESSDPTVVDLEDPVREIDRSVFVSGRGIPFQDLAVQESTSTITTTNEVTVDGSVTLNTSLEQRRRGEIRHITENIDTQTLGDRIISRDLVHFMRPRNIEFSSSKMKPNTQVYAFFDDIDVNKYCTPKLIEISMTSGTFQVGETVEAEDNTFAARVANSNHKYGPYNNPDVVYANSPYDRKSVIPSTYSSTSTTLNIDTFSLQDENTPNFEGHVKVGMKIRGSSSGAQATVTNVRLVTDYQGVLIGCFEVPNSDIAGNPSWETGKSIFRLTNSSINSKLSGVITTSAEQVFYSQGDIDNTQEATLSLRNASVSFEERRDEKRSFNLSNTATATATDTSTTETAVVSRNTRVIDEGFVDPLAQSFIVRAVDSSIFATKVDLFFRTKDSTLPVQFYISEVNFGTPTTTIVPFSNIFVYPDDVNLSEDASVATTITFESPVYLESGKQYALVLLSDSTEYTVWISRLGEFDVKTVTNESTQVLVTQQPTLGSLFKSQNASTWTPSQYEDLKFNLYRAKFVSSGSASFFNAPLPEKLKLLKSDPLDITSRTVKIGIGTILQDPDLTNGNVITQLGSGATGNLVGSAGTCTGDLKIINAGIGYTPSLGNFTFNNVSLNNIEGEGRNATANITISDGVAIAATVSNGGTGYSVGDLLTSSSIGIASLGRNLRLSVSQLSGINELTLNQVQGDFIVGSGNTLTYVNGSGISTTMNSAYSGNVIVTQPVQVIDDGLHVNVFQRNHGMHSDVNKVIISGAKSSIKPSLLTDDYDSSSTSDILISNGTEFENFEGVSVGSTNPGYAMISNEIIKYTGVSGNTLTGITREISGTKAFSYSVDDEIYKYELNGVSLIRINKTHSLSDSEVSDSIGLDHYNIKIDTSSTTPNTTDRSTGTGMPKLFFAADNKFGGNKVQSTYNVPFDAVTPNMGVVTPKLTGINASVRTVSGRSIDGSETPYEDQGFEQISLVTTNYFDSSRVVASEVNENERLTALPANKSFSMDVNMLSENDRLSPCIDLAKTSMTLTSNRINQPIVDYTTDARVKSYKDDPNAFIYVSSPIVIENPATAIKLLISGSLHNSADIRAFYSLQNNVEEDPIFTPFPGFANLDSSGQKIDTSASTGSPDNVPVKNDSFSIRKNYNSFRDYTFTDDNLPEFKIFRVKLVFTSTNQAFPPILKDLRAIALA